MDYIAYVLDQLPKMRHHGVKGQRWGIRRQRGPDGTVTGNTDANSSSADGTSSEVHVSADVERFIRTHQKMGVEMSDREIKEAINRANMVKEYNKIFAPDANQKLKSTVEQLRLRKEYAQLKAELTPNKMKAVAALIAATSKGGWDAYQKLNKATDGVINEEIAKAFGLSTTYQPKHRATGKVKVKK